MAYMLAYTSVVGFYFYFQDDYDSDLSFLLLLLGCTLFCFCFIKAIFFALRFRGLCSCCHLESDFCHLKAPWLKNVDTLKEIWKIPPELLLNLKKTSTGNRLDHSPEIQGRRLMHNKSDTSAMFALSGQAEFFNHCDSNCGNQAPYQPLLQFLLL